MARILIVEDEPSIGLILSEVIRGEGHETVVLSDGAVAKEWLAQSVRPDLILLDLFMPGVNGRELLDVIRSTPELADTPVVLVTGAVPNGSNFPPAGTYQALLSKPFNLGDLVAVVRDCLGALKIA